MSNFEQEMLNDEVLTGTHKKGANLRRASFTVLQKM